MSITKEFREFAVKGSVLDLAVGIIIGAAFGTVVSSFVEDIIMPPIGKLIGGVDFTNLYIPLDEKTKGLTSLEEAKKAGAVIAYGNFLQNVITFLIVAFAVFLIVKAANSLRRKQAATPEEAPATPTREELILLDIRDAVRNNRTAL